jgi:rubrerythrin
MNWNSLEDVIRFAIRKEADAAAFYRMAAGRSNPGVKTAFEELARMEDGHKKQLESFDPKKIGKVELKETKGLGLAEAMEDVPFSSDMNYAELLKMAIKNEEKAEQLYTGMASWVTDPQIKKLLTMLAHDETGHKKQLEKIYDDEVLEEF